MIEYSIVIPTYNHLEDCLKPCLQSLIKYTDLSNKEIIVVANGCNDKTKEYVESLGESFRLIFIEDGIGYTKATNIGINNSIGDYIILLNNDVELLFQEKDSWINILKEPFLKNKNMAISGPLLKKHDLINKNFLIFFCVMIKKEIFNKLGVLDESFSPGFNEDADFCFKAQDKGYDIEEVCPNKEFPIFHQAEKTFHDTEHFEKFNFIVRRNEEILYNRYKEDIVNIIVPTYKRYGLLEKALNSVINQTYKGKVYVYVCSDGPDEKVKKIAEKFNSFNLETVFKYLCLDDHEGALGGKPRILGINSIDNNGYVIFLDDDNILYPNYIEKVKYEIDKEKSDVYFCKINHDLCGIIPKDNKVEFGNIDSLNIIVKSEIAKKCSCKWLHDKNSNIVTHDFDFINECLKYCEKISFIDDILGEHCYTKQNFIEEEKNMKLHLGCGNSILKGYINCDKYSKRADVNCDCLSLPFKNNSVKEICAYHFIEHLNFKEGFVFIEEISRVLTEDGVLTLECPDLNLLCAKFVNSTEEEKINLYLPLYGLPWEEGHAHKFNYTHNQLKYLLNTYKFNYVEKEDPITHLDYKDVCMRVKASKKPIKKVFKSVKDKEEQDPFIYKEIFKDNTYNITLEEICGKNVVDIGANLGFFSILCLQNEAKHIWAFESNTNIFNKLKSNLEDFENISIFNKAVFDLKTEYLYFEGTDGKSLVNTSGVEENKIECISFNELCKMLPEDDNDMILKMDCEGAEFEIIFDASVENIRRFKIINIEVHGFLKEDKEKYNIIKFKEKMSYFGFKQKIEPLIWFEKIFDQNGRFIKKEIMDVQTIKFERV